MKSKKGISLLSYTEEDIRTVEKLLSEIPGVYDIEPITRKETRDTSTVHIFKLKLNRLKFKILIHDHISELAAINFSFGVNAAFSGCHFNFGMWIIDSAKGNYTPTDILNIIQYICVDSEKYNTKEQSELLDKYILANIYEDYNDESYAIDTANIFAHGFMTDNHISDNQYHTNYHVLNKMFFDKLNHIEL